MSVGLGAVLLSTGTIADDYGRRRTFVAGMLVLALASFLAALAPQTPCSCSPGCCRGWAAPR